MYIFIFDFIECFTTTFLRAHSWLNWVDEDDDEVGLKEEICIGHTLPAVCIRHTLPAVCIGHTLPTVWHHMCSLNMEVCEL